MKSLWSTLVLLSLVLSTAALADNRDRGHAEDKGHKEDRKEEHSKDKDQKTFTVDKTAGSGPLTIRFDASRIHSAKKYHFSFGNGETLVTRNSIVTYTYKRAGTFTASLQYSVKNKDHDRDDHRHEDRDDKKHKDKHKDNGKDDELKNLKDGGSVVINVINTAPSVDLFASVSEGVIPLNVEFQAKNLIDTDGDIVSVEWIFSDGTIASGVNISHVFTSIGAFTAKLVVTDNMGAVTTKETTITALEPLREPPFIVFKYFQDGSTQIDLRSSYIKTQFAPAIMFYTIDGNQTIPVLEFYSNTKTLVDLKTYGPHTITLTAVDIRGQRTSKTHLINMVEDPSTQIPVVDFRVV